jgi:formylmethanofuran dehydrogenase subunit C
MNKRQRKKFEKKHEQEIQNISNVFQKLKAAIDNMFEQMRKDPAEFRKRIVESNIPDESKSIGIAMSYITQANQKED